MRIIELFLRRVALVILVVAMVGVVVFLLPAGKAQQPEIPTVLKPWEPWVLWGADDRNSPNPYDDSSTNLRSWPLTLRFNAFQDRATWQFDVIVYSKDWIQLPGDRDTWPLSVQSQNGPLPVLLRDGMAAVHLDPGHHQIRGEFRWSHIPQRIALPKSMGIVSLQIEGQDITFPNWDSDGWLWLKRQQNEDTQQNQLGVKVYRVIEDGIPMWLRTKVVLSVSGKSREEDLGNILPEKWQTSSVESPVPVAIDEQGRMKAQVRPGNWTVQIDAFCNTDLKEFQYSAQTRTAVDKELIGFRTQPLFRVAEISGLASVDVQQTEFPEGWRSLPVYEWNTQVGFKIVEKMRGMGSQKPKGLGIRRRFWLDDDGEGVTYQDRVEGELQQIGRLDSAPGHELGVVRIDGQRQLITTNPNPIDGSPGNEIRGVEIRSRNLRMEALGRVERARAIPAVGWLVNVDSLQWTVLLPPGWRVLTVFGADDVEGDWLTAWTLLDLFLVLIFSLAVYRLWGLPAGLLALLAFGLSYHEPGSPRWTWLFLLMPTALLRVTDKGAIRSLTQLWRYVALALLMLNLVPFMARQVQIFLYPQLEQVGIPYTGRPMFPGINATYESGERMADIFLEDKTSSIEFDRSAPRQTVKQSANLAFDPARTQTGPAEPEWSGNVVFCRWDGPVTREQQVTPIYLSREVNRILTIVRCVLILLLLALLVCMQTIFRRGACRYLFLRKASTAVLAVALAGAAGNAHGQFPNPDLLKTLRERLLETSDAFPNAASIANLDVSINDGRLRMNLEVHSAGEVAIPLPGKLPIWSPVSVRIAKQAESEALKDAVVCRRENGHLWALVPQGIHFLRVEGNLANADEWVLAFPLAPHHVTIAAPQWQVVGLQPNGVPESQLFFSRFEKKGENEAKYDQRVYRPIVMVERRLEIGLVWKVHGKVTRLSAPGKAVALKIPLLSGERVFSSNSDSQSTSIEVNLAADQASSTWESGLDIKEQLLLKAAATDQYVERWVLEGSPVWHITFDGVPPIYEAQEQELIPVWQTWPNEEVILDIQQPQATSGELVTVRRVAQTMALGMRQRTTRFQLDVESSLGGDFDIDLGENVDANSLLVKGVNQAIRRNGSKLIVPLQPGLQSVEMNWSSDEPMQMKVPVSQVTLPVESANVTTVIEVPENRWVLWTSGPMRGPAVRFWIFLVSALMVAVALGKSKFSSVRTYEWVLLALGLTQIHAMMGLIVVAWLYALAWRGKNEPKCFSRWLFNFMQLGLVLLTAIVLGIFIVIVGKGLLGNPEMFIVGNGSTRNYLKWFEPKSGMTLSQPSIIAVSVWFYRLLMLLWALWLASALLRWLQTGWESFSFGGRWAYKRPKNITQAMSP